MRLGLFFGEREQGVLASYIKFACFGEFLEWCASRVAQERFSGGSYWHGGFGVRLEKLYVTAVGFAFALAHLAFSGEGAEAGLR